MVKSIKKIPINDDSYPFQDAARTCRFAEIGYVEDEYFISGTANVYEPDKNDFPIAVYENAPYTNRILVRRPADTAKFSGNIVVEILNASAMMDIDRMWVNAWKYFTRNGDIYIGVTSKGHVVDALKRFDPVRYAEINWSNPAPGRKEPPKASGPFAPLEEYELGLFWDILRDVAVLLRSDKDENPIADYKNRWIYLTGWSQSGGYLARWLKSFAYSDIYTESEPLFDGYMMAGCGADAVAMNNYEPGRMLRERGVPKASVIGAKQPLIAINTESENRIACWGKDFDQPEYKFRSYQIPGSSHDSNYNLIEYYGDFLDADTTKIGKGITYKGVDGEPLDAPYEYIFNAAFRNLYAWVRDGVPAPHAPYIETEITEKENADPFGVYVRNVTDVFGNAKGGIRSAFVDFPVGKYTSYSTKADGELIQMFGKVNPFSATLLKELYCDTENYRVLVEKSADKMIAVGFLLEEDKDDFIEKNVKLAQKRGL